MKKYKILSLDGGGSWSILQALALRDIYQRLYPDREITGHEVLRDFDLVIANSGGSVLLAALACNWTFDKIINETFNEQELSKVFSKLSFREKYFPNNFFFGWKKVGPRYSKARKYEALNNLFKEIIDKEMMDLPTYIGKPSLELMVCTFDHLNKKAKFFRSNPNSMARSSVQLGHDSFDSVSLVKAVHGAANAPLNYFDFSANIRPKTRSGKTKKDYVYLWDGALGGFNNPVAAGVTEAIANGISRENISILSIGTGNKYSMPLEKKEAFKRELETIMERKYNIFKGWNYFMDVVVNLSKSILYEPPDWANYVAYIMRFGGDFKVENFSKFVRLSPLIYSSGRDAENFDLISKLSDLDMDLHKSNDLHFLKEDCYDNWKNGTIVNQGIQGTIVDDEYKVVLGHQTYEEGIMDWVENNPSDVVA